MAEGHVVRRNAERFHGLLAGKAVVRASWRSRRVSLRPEQVEGQRVARVGFAGKNHLFEMADGGVFRVHLMMYGSVQAGKPGEPLRKPEPRLRFLLQTRDARVAVFSAPIVEYYAPRETIPAVATLGPDALKEPFDAAEFRRRLAAAPHATVAEALLDPTVVAGVGNIYKSEALWEARLHPARAPGSLRPRELQDLSRVVPATMLRAYRTLGTRAYARTQRIYQEGGRPCPRCKTPLRAARLGERSTYWCAACQPRDADAPRPRRGQQRLP